MGTSCQLRSLLFLFLVLARLAVGATEGSLSGTITDNSAIAVPNANVRLLTPDGRVVKEMTTSVTGVFSFFPLDFGTYTLSIRAAGFAPYESEIAVSSGTSANLDVHLLTEQVGKEGTEMVMKVKAKRQALSPAPSSSLELTQEKIQELPQGEAISLPKLLSTTAPGVVSGPFGQLFIRGNHANIQYQIDGVQLPDSPSNTFGDAFSPRNIERMEFITGGIPAEYGERLAAVVNIVSRTGPEKPFASAQLNYGSYNYFSPIGIVGGSNDSGNFHYFFSANYNSTERGLDTPQPSGDGTNFDVTQGGSDAVHDFSNGNNEFGKMDWIADNDNKFTLVLFHAYKFFQIPNFPSSFGSNSNIFQVTGPNAYTDPFGNGPANYVPSNTDDNQAERNIYAEFVWKHSYSEHSFLQVAPYWKYSSIKVNNDQTNDLAAAIPPPGLVAASSPSSFTEDKSSNNLGLKTDYTWRVNDQHLVKAGFQFQASQSTGSIGIITTNANPQANPPTSATQVNPTYTDNSPDVGFFEAIYAQDDFTITKSLIVNAGLRFDATQFQFSDARPTDYLFQPRIGVTYLLSEETKFHAFYGKLFQPAPIENLRNAFDFINGTPNGSPYDIKAEKDDYVEVGVAQVLPANHAISVNFYYKWAKDMLDDTQLLNTSIASPYNFDHGFAYGLEVTLQGQITDELSDYLNYSYEIAKGQGINGGIFTGVIPSTDYQFLDHVQIHTANAGLTYKHGGFFSTVQGLLGSGLRTGNNNVNNLPLHVTFDATVGYTFTGDSWWANTKVSGDVLNILNNMYPITIANGYNGSHYAAGRQFYIRLTKDF